MLQIQNCIIFGGDGGTGFYSNGGDAVFTGSLAQYVEVSNCVLAKAGNGYGYFIGTNGQAINDTNIQPTTFAGGASIFGNVAYNISGATYYTIHNVANNPTYVFNGSLSTAATVNMLQGNLYFP